MQAIGIYWTRPVPWAGFKGTPANPDLAAAKSRTIRYQRALIQRAVKDRKWQLADEVVLNDLHPDRASPETVAALKKFLLSATEQTVFVWVDFSVVNGWRSHPYLRQSLFGYKNEALWPDPILLDGVEFDPIQHFKLWRDRERAHIEQKAAHRRDILATLQGIGAGSWPQKAEALNRAGLQTHHGKPWTGDNLRKFVAAAAVG